MKEELLGLLGLQGGRKGFNFSAFCPCSLLVLRPVESQGSLPCASRNAEKGLRRDGEKKDLEGNLWRERVRENRVRLVGNSGKGFPLL